jgi:hypothetical protein
MGPQITNWRCALDAQAPPPDMGLRIRTLLFDDGGALKCLFAGD